MRYWIPLFFSAFILWNGLGIANAQTGTQNLVVTESNNGSTVRIGVNQNLTLRLMHLPVPGNKWIIKRTPDNRILGFVNSEFEGKKGVVGARMTQVIRYVGSRIGTTSLTLAMANPQGAALSGAEEYRLTVVVERGSPGGSGEIGSNITLADRDNGRQVKLRVGDSITVRLLNPDDSRFPWTPQSVPNSLLRQDKQPRDDDSSRIAGQVFRYQTVKAGKGQLRFAYWGGAKRGGRPLRTWQVDFTIDRR